MMLFLILFLMREQHKRGVMSKMSKMFISVAQVEQIVSLMRDGKLEEARDCLSEIIADNIEADLPYNNSGAEDEARALADAEGDLEAEDEARAEAVMDKFDEANRMGGDEPDYDALADAELERQNEALFFAYGGGSDE